MDGLEHTLDQLRAHDPRRLPARISSARLGAEELAAIPHAPGGQRRAAARLVVDALAVLAGVGGFASDVRDLIGEDGHIHEWGNDYRSCSCGQRNPADAGTVRRIYPALVHDTAGEPDPHLGPVRRPRIDGADYCSEHDLDGPCPHEHATPARYPAGPAGDRESWRDLEYTADD